MTQTEVAELIKRLTVLLGKLEYEGLHVNAWAVADAIYNLEDQLLNPTREGM